MCKKKIQRSVVVTKKMDSTILGMAKKYNSDSVQEEIRIILSEGIKARCILKSRKLNSVLDLILSKRINHKNLNKIESDRYYHKIISDDGTEKTYPIYEYEDKLYTHVDF